MFYSTRDSEYLQSIINEELGKVLKICAANMLSINFKKTNYMIITSPRKKMMKYLGLFIHEHLKWDAQL